MLVKLCLGSLEEKVVRALSFFKRPCCLVYIVYWVAVSDCCIYVLNDIGNVTLGIHLSSFGFQISVIG